MEGRGSPLITLDPFDKDSNGKRSAVRSVAWAASCGRSFHTIAGGYRDGRVRVWRVDPSEPRSGSVSNNNWKMKLVGEFVGHAGGVNRVDWNVTGTLLTTSGMDGEVKLWKQTMGGVWRGMAKVTGS